MPRMIAPVVATRSGPLRRRTHLWLIAVLFGSSVLTAHDLEKTQVRIAFARDGSFVVDVDNDPAWLKLRLETIPGSFADRVVMWVDGREVRPTSVERIRGAQLDTHRLRGTMPRDARTLRWYYGLVIDPYPLTVTRADGRIIVEEVQGDAWSRPLDLSHQFDAPRISATIAGAAIAALLLIPIAIRVLTRRS